MHRVWALVAGLLFLGDLAMPLSPGAFQFEPGQSLEIARRASIPPAPVGHLPLRQHPSRSTTRIARVPEAGRSSARDDDQVRLVCPCSAFRAPQDESEAQASSEDG